MIAHGFLIDPKEKTITPVLMDTSDYKNIYKLLDITSPFTVVEIDKTNLVYVDDEGLLKADPRYYFSLEGFPSPLASRGLVLGSDEEGETISTTLSLEALQAMVSFSERKLLGFKVEEGIADVLGEPGWSIKSTPVFGPAESDNNQ